jgi:hypothetical protein
LKPKSHLVGTLNSSDTSQFSSIIFIISHFLFQSFSITDQADSLGTETATLSIGSILTQFSICIITSGAQTCSSNPSLLIVSIKTDKCNSHLHETIKLSHSKSIFIHTFVSSSFSSLSLICLDVTIFHSFHANGELFTKNSIFSVGSSIVIGGN